MDSTPEAQLNQAAYRQLCDFIRRSFPPGRFVGIAGGKIVADAPSLVELNTLLHKIGYRSTEVLVVQAGVDYPETAVIFTQELQA